MENLIITSELLHEHDGCQRACTWNHKYAPFRYSLNKAMNGAIRAAFLSNDPSAASAEVLRLATNPGLDIQGTKIYDTVIHTSRLCEVLSAYLLSTGRVEEPEPIAQDWGQYGLCSFLLPDGRLRRVILCDRWNLDREQMERFSWRTAADCAISNRPMLLNVLVIGGLRNGFRSGPWVMGFEHPKSGEVRVQKRDGTFVDSWRSVYREQTSLSAIEWLRIMQSDGAFEERVFSLTQDVPANREEVLDQIRRMANEIKEGALRQTRSNCYRFKPCPFLPACLSGKSPSQLGWIEKDSASNLESAILTPTIV